MMNTNIENAQVGRNFQKKVKQWFESNKKLGFKLEHPICIGNPAKPHRFDICDEGENIVIECKCYAWTNTGNIPSAKLTTLNEAIFYFTFLPAETEKILVMAYAVHPNKSETLAEYYFRTHCHLLGDIKIMEFCVETDEMRIIKE